MAAETESPTEPGLAEGAFYFGTGMFLGFLLVATIGLSVYGHHSTADARNERVTSSAASSDAQERDVGEQIFALRCAACHGPDGGGGVGPSFDGIVERIPDIGDHLDTVRQGRGQMPSFEGILTDGQIDLVVRFEREVLDG